MTITNADPPASVPAMKNDGLELRPASEAAVPQATFVARKRHRIAEIDLEIAHLQHEKKLIRAELAAK